MNGAKHTPGPWRKGWLHGTFAIEADSPTDPGKVFLVAASVSERDMPLLVAAPELLAAAKLVLAWYEAEDDHKDTTFMRRVEMCRESEAAIRSAIAKATGAAS